MAAVDSIAKPLTADGYELLAATDTATDTAAGYAAWSEGRIKRAIWLWRSAARWSQYARKARGGAR